MDRKTKKQIVIISILAIFLIVSLVVTEWGHVEPTRLIAISVVIIFSILLAVFQPFRKRVLRVLNVIGEDKDSIKKRPPWLFLLVPFILFIVCFYILLGDSQVAVPSTLQFNIIIVSATLGGLVLATATISRVKRAKRRELLSVAQKLIVATILFVFTTALLFLVELLGGIDANSFEWTTKGLFRGIFFWATVICFFSGVILFSFGIIDLILALSHMRRPNN